MFNANDVLTVSHGVIWLNARPYNRDNVKQGQFLTRVNEASAFISVEDLSLLPLIIDTRHEGQGQLEFESMVQELLKTTWFSQERCFWINNVFVEDQPRVISVPLQMTNHSNWFSFVKEIDRDWATSNRKQKFVCLMRRQSPSRTKLAIDITKQFLPEQFVLTCSSMAFSNYFDYENNIKFPILLDGRVDFFQQHHLNHPDVFDCLINAVVETSNQLDAEVFPVWNSLFITEKSFKAFAWHQIPIWFAVPGLVEKIRSLGFDVFDDLLHDHDYDHVSDQNLRFAKVLIYIKELLSTPLDVNSLIPRFKHNISLLETLDHNPMRSDSYLANLVINSYNNQKTSG